MPANVSLNGAGAQAVTIQRLNVSSNVTLLTMGSNCRAENFTANLSSSSNVNLIGVDFPTGTVPTAKLRNSIWTVTSTATGSNTILACRSAGTSATTFTAANMIQRSTLNVVSSSTGTTRGILVSGSNRFSVRDIVIYARGDTGTDIVGVETTNAGAFFDSKTSTINGATHDINRTAGTIQLGFTDLVNNDANGNSFSVSTEPNHIYTGVTGNIGNGTHYLGPGTVTYNNLETAEFALPFAQPVMVFEGVFRATAPMTTGVATFTLHKNASSNAAFMTGTLDSNNQTFRATNTSERITLSDYLVVKLVTSGNIGGNPIFAAIGTY